jgi:hypothetical protein
VSPYAITCAWRVLACLPVRLAVVPGTLACLSVRKDFGMFACAPCRGGHRHDIRALACLCVPCSRAKYSLQHLVRVNLAGQDRAYRCVYQLEDDNGEHRGDARVRVWGGGQGSTREDGRQVKASMWTCAPGYDGMCDRLSEATGPQPSATDDDLHLPLADLLGSPRAFQFTPWLTCHVSCPRAFGLLYTVVTP